MITSLSKGLIPWLPGLGISYFLGVDGISAPLMLLGALVVTFGVMVSWNVEDRPREFFAFLMFLGTSVLGVFSSLDMFQLFFFFELAVFPKYLMIAMWGSPKTRDYGAMKLTLYLFIGSVIALVGVLAMYVINGQQSGVYTFNMLELEKAGFTTGIPAMGSRWSSWALPSWGASSPSTPGRRMVTWLLRPPSRCCWRGWR